MKNKDTKFKSFSFIYDALYFAIFIILSLVIGALLNSFAYSLIIALFIFVLKILYENYKLEKIILDFDGKSLDNYPKKNENLILKINKNYEDLLSISDKFNALEKRFKELSNSMPDAAVVIDKKLNTEWFNEAARKMLFFEEIDIGRPILHLIRNPNFTDFLNSKERDFYVYFTSPQNYNMTIQCFIVPYAEDKFLLTFRDVSQLDKLDKMRQDFVANVSHELKTPLTVLFGYLETISIDNSLGFDQKIIDEMLKQAKRMDTLISDLLKLTKLQTTNIPDKKFSIINLEEIINELVTSFDKKSKINKNEIKFSISNKLYIRGVYEEIYSAFSNLVNNAIMYSEKGTNIEIQCTPSANGEIVFSVKDYGVGIPPEDIDRITERFYRVDKGRSREQGGTGLGLSIVKHILIRHGARLEVSSEPDVGSQFTCIFPKAN